MIKLELTEKRINLCSEHTSYINITLPKCVVYKELIDKLEELRLLSKNDVRVNIKGIRAFKSYLIDNYNQYLKEYDKIEFSFLDAKVTLLEVSKEMEKYNFDIKNHIQEISNHSNEYAKNFYRNTLFSQYMEKYITLKKVIQEIKHLSEDVVKVTYTL